MQAETLKQQISAAKGEVDAELVLKRAKVVNREWIYRKAATNFSREPENRVQKVLYGALLAGNLILLAGTENSANGISWLILVIGSK